MFISKEVCLTIQKCTQILMLHKILWLLFELFFIDTDGARDTPLQDSVELWHKCFNILLVVSMSWHKCFSILLVVSMSWTDNNIDICDNLLIVVMSLLFDGTTVFMVMVN